LWLVNSKTNDLYFYGKLELHNDSTISLSTCWLFITSRFVGRYVYCSIYVAIVVFLWCLFKSDKDILVRDLNSTMHVYSKIEDHGNLCYLKLLAMWPGGWLGHRIRLDMLFLNLCLIFDNLWCFFDVSIYVPNEITSEAHIHIAQS
jgi:hypothetical protein